MLLSLPFLIFLQVAMAVRRIQPRVISLNSSTYHFLFDAADKKYTNVSELLCVFRCANQNDDAKMSVYDDKDRVCSCVFQFNTHHIIRGSYRNVSVVDLTGTSNATTRTGCRSDQEGN